MDLPTSKLQSSTNCPKCGYENLPERVPFCPECEAAILTSPKPTAQIEVTQEVGTVEGGQLVGVDLGEVLGDVSIGNYTLRIGTLNGGVVNLAPPQQHQQAPQARPTPVRLLPRKSPGLLDRKQETSIVTSALLSASPAEFHGPPGIGKTKLLRHLAYQQFASVCPDGVVCLSAVRRKPLEDTLLDLFDAFYEREVTYKPTAVQVRYSLQDKQALVILDEIELERDEVAALMDAAPSCTFLLASTECCLWGEGRALALRGLPIEDALMLIERELGRSLRADEHTVAEHLCHALEGHPLRLMQLAALVREADRSLNDLSSQLQEETGSPAKALTEQAISVCSEQEKRVLAVLATSRGASLGKQHVSDLTGIEDIGGPIESLKRRKLAQSHSPRYSLTGSLGRTLEEEWDLTPWNVQALEHFAAWAEQHRQNPQLVAEETDAILGILGWALQEQRWEGALRLGRAVEGALAVGGQWGVWAQVLSLQFQAARGLGDRASEAWSLHQSGTQAMCLENSTTARTNLSEALRIRETLGDWPGAAVTRHNLDLFLGGPGGGSSGPQGNGNGGGGGGRWPIPRLRRWQWLGALGAALVALGLSASAVLSGARPLESNNLLEPAKQLLEPAKQLLEPAAQLLEPAVRPALDAVAKPFTPWFKPDPNNANSSNNPSGAGGASGTESPSGGSDSSGSSGSGGSGSEEPSGTKSPSDSGSSDTKSANDDGNGSESSTNKSSSDSVSGSSSGAKEKTPPPSEDPSTSKDPDTSTSKDPDTSTSEDPDTSTSEDPDTSTSEDPSGTPPVVDDGGVISKPPDVVGGTPPVVEDGGVISKPPDVVGTDPPYYPPLH